MSNQNTNCIFLLFKLLYHFVQRCFVFFLFLSASCATSTSTFHHPAISRNKTLEFDIYSNNKVDLIGKDKISIKCTGPYVLYMYACYRSLYRTNVTGMLQLQVVESVPIASVMMNTSAEDCSGLHSIAYLKAKNQASLRLYAPEGFKLKNVTVGLSYLLGTRCEI